MDKGLLSESLFEAILVEPARELDRARLDMVVGYASPSLAAYHISQFERRYVDKRLDIRLVLGMVAEDGMRIDQHRGFTKLAGDLQPGAGRVSLRCRYLLAPQSSHAKVYVWGDGTDPVAAFQGSANYTHAGFGVGRGLGTRSEVASPVQAHLAAAYFQRFWDDSIDCGHPDVESEFLFYRDRPAARILDTGTDTSPSPVADALATFAEKPVRLSLVSSRTGRVHNPGGGLNHGQRAERRNKNEAYIPVPASVQRSDFFPPPGQHFLVSTDDSKVLIMSTGSGDGGKDLRTPLRNGDLGEYLRLRLQIPSGAPFTDERLEEYGRNYVEFYKIDDETYYMDFRPSSLPH